MPGGRPRKVPKRHVAMGKLGARRRQELRLERLALQEQELLRAAQVPELLGAPVEPPDEELQSSGEGEIKIEAGVGEQDIGNHHHQHPAPSLIVDRVPANDEDLNEESTLNTCEDIIVGHATRPPIPSPSFCFVCVAPLDPHDDQGGSKVTDADLLSLLTSILELTPLKARHCVQKLKGPEKWIGLCQKCWSVMGEVSSAKERIIQLEKEARRCKRRIVETIKVTTPRAVWGTATSKKLHEGGTDSEDGVKEQILAIDNILRYVCSRKYYSLRAGPRSRSGGAEKQSAVGGADDADNRSPGRPKNYLGTRGRLAGAKSRPKNKNWSWAKKRNVSNKLEDKDVDLGDHQDQHEDIDEGLIFMETDTLRNGELARDPLSFEGDDGGGDDVEINDLMKEEDDPEPHPAIPVPVQGIKPQTYYCGLCDTDQAYTSEEQLQFHTNKCHRPPAPQNTGKRKKRRRKQKFSYGSDSEQEEEDAGDFLLPDASATVPNKRVVPTIDENSPAVLEPASKILKKKIKPELIIQTLPGLVEEAEEGHIPTFKISIRSAGNPGKKIKHEPIIKNPKEEVEKEAEEAPIPGFRLTIKTVGMPMPSKSPVESVIPRKLVVPRREMAKACKAASKLGAATSWENRQTETAEVLIKCQRRMNSAPEPGNKYDCPVCPNVKNYGINRIAQHLAIHHRRPYKCTVCSALFPPDDGLMDEHWKEKHSTEESPPQRFLKVSLELGHIWKCGDKACQEVFTSEESRHKHELTCSLLAASQSSDARPPTLLTPTRHSCKICLKSFRIFEEWRLHRALHHPEVDIMSCLRCDISFAEKTVDGGGTLEVRNDMKMLEHISKDHCPRKGREKRNQFRRGRIYEECEPCGLVFGFKDGRDMMAHFLEVHGFPKGGKIFPCPLACGDMFTRGFGVRSHVNLRHLSRDTQICDICGTSFNHPDYLKKHKLNKHGIHPEGCKVWSCRREGCEFKALKNYDLTHHSQVVHGNVRKHVCKYCGKGFADSSKLRVHKQIHENKEKKPYQCEICGNSFAVRNYLYIHKRLSHEGRTFPNTNRKRVPATRKPKKDAVGARNQTAVPEQVDNNVKGEQNAASEPFSYYS